VEVYTTLTLVVSQTDHPFALLIPNYNLYSIDHGGKESIYLSKIEIILKKEPTAIITPVARTVIAFAVANISPLLIEVTPPQIANTPNMNTK
jgi:hypothetical protein